MILKNVERKVNSLKRRQTMKESIRHLGNQEPHEIYSGGRWRTYELCISDAGVFSVENQQLSRKRGRSMIEHARMLHSSVKPLLASGHLSQFRPHWKARVLISCPWSMYRVEVDAVHVEEEEVIVSRLFRWHQRPQRLAPIQKGKRKITTTTSR